jgi:hypothetical protein
MTVSESKKPGESENKISSFYTIFPEIKLALANSKKNKNQG